MAVTRPAPALTQQHSIDDLFEELRRLRQIVERLASQPQPERAWVTVSEAASLSLSDRC
jgi:hypothetical protein